MRNVNDALRIFLHHVAAVKFDAACDADVKIRSLRDVDFERLQSRIFVFRRDFRERNFLRLREDGLRDILGRIPPVIADFAAPRLLRPVLRKDVYLKRIPDCVNRRFSRKAERDDLLLVAILVLREDNGAVVHARVASHSGNRVIPLFRAHFFSAGSRCDSRRDNCAHLDVCRGHSERLRCHVRAQMVAAETHLRLVIAFFERSVARVLHIRNEFYLAGKTFLVKRKVRAHLERKEFEVGIYVVNLVAHASDIDGKIARRKIELRRLERYVRRDEVLFERDDIFRRNLEILRSLKTQDRLVLPHPGTLHGRFYLHLLRLLAYIGKLRHG